MSARVTRADGLRVDMPLSGGSPVRIGVVVCKVMAYVALIAVVGCSAVQIDVAGSAPETAEMAVATSRPDVLRALGSALAHRAVRVVESGIAAYQIWPEFSWGSGDTKRRGPSESWVRGGISGDRQYGGGALWLEFGRETDYSSLPRSNAQDDRRWTALTLTIVSRRDGRVVWRGTYQDWNAPRRDAAEWPVWLESAASALVQRMTLCSST